MRKASRGSHFAPGNGVYGNRTERMRRIGGRWVRVKLKRKTLLQRWRA